MGKRPNVFSESFYLGKFAPLIAPQEQSPILRSLAQPRPCLPAQLSFSFVFSAPKKRRKVSKGIPVIVDQLMPLKSRKRD